MRAVLVAGLAILCVACGSAALAVDAGEDRKLGSRGPDAAARDVSAEAGAGDSTPPGDAGSGKDSPGPSDGGADVNVDGGPDVDADGACVLMAHDSCVTCCEGLYPIDTKAYNQALELCVCKFDLGICPCTEFCAGFPSEGDAGACASCMAASTLAGGACVKTIDMLCAGSSCNQLVNCWNSNCGGWPYRDAGSG